MLNRVVLIGRTTKEIELRYTPTGVAVSNFTLAIDRNFKNAQGERETDFVPCVAYRQTAEFIANNLPKGKMAAVDGRIQIRSYDAQDGQKRWVTEIIAENVHLLRPKDNAGQQTQTPSQQTGYGQSPAQGAPPAQGYAPPQGKPPAQNFPGNPPGQMPPPPGYQQGAPNWLPPNGQQGQPQPGQQPQGGQQQQQFSYGHQVNIPNDEIPF